VFDRIGRIVHFCITQRLFTGFRTARFHRAGELEIEFIDRALQVSSICLTEIATRHTQGLVRTLAEKLQRITLRLHGHLRIQECEIGTDGTNPRRPRHDHFISLAADPFGRRGNVGIRESIHRFSACFRRQFHERCCFSDPRCAATRGPAIDHDLADVFRRDGLLQRHRDAVRIDHAHAHFSKRASAFREHAIHRDHGHTGLAVDGPVVVGIKNRRR